MIDEENGELRHQSVAQATLVLERLEECWFVNQIIAQSEGDATNEENSTVGHNLEREVTRLVAEVLRHLLDALHEERVLCLESHANHVLSSDVVNGNSGTMLILDFKDLLKLGVLRLHVLVDEGHARTGDKSLNTKTVGVSLDLEVLLVG